jgi:DNA-binding transcriptional ArsR family regulator
MRVRHGNTSTRHGKLAGRPVYVLDAAMNTQNSTSLKLEGLVRVLGCADRWRILRELAKGQALPVQELGRRVGCSAAQASKHMTLLREVGLVAAGFGRLYSFTPAVRVLAEEKLIDLGHCLVRME